MNRRIKTLSTVSMNASITRCVYVLLKKGELLLNAVKRIVEVKSVGLVGLFSSPNILYHEAQAIDNLPDPLR